MKLSEIKDLFEFDRHGLYTDHIDPHDRWPQHEAGVIYEIRLKDQSEADNFTFESNDDYCCHLMDYSPVLSFEFLREHIRERLLHSLVFAWNRPSDKEGGEKLSELHLLKATAEGFGFDWPDFPVVGMQAIHIIGDHIESRVYIGINKRVALTKHNELFNVRLDLKDVETLYASERDLTLRLFTLSDHAQGVWGDESAESV